MSTLDSCRPTSTRLRHAAAAALMLCATLAAQAAPVASPFDFDEFGGPDSPAMGGGLLFSPAFGIGGWIGVLQGLGPAAPSFDTLAFFDATPQGGGFDISGSFFFIFRDIDGLTPEEDSLTGTLVGSLLPDAANPALQRVEVNYTISAGSGLFAGFTGSGRSMFSFDNSGREPYNYAGSGSLLLQGPAVVPAPGTLALAALGLLAVAGLRRRPAGAPLAG